ncbi:MAG: histidine decarboxylase [Paracoccaceae bacterium]|jgi:histidine decarboxylase
MKITSHDSADFRTGFPPALQEILDNAERRIKTAHAEHLGYPYNLDFSPHVPANFGNFLINNLGDPYAGSHYASEVCGLEQQAVSWLMRLWGCYDLTDYWGSIGASGTEGNLWALYLGREAQPEAVLLHSAEAHYSIPKAARILRIEAREVLANPAGEIDLADLAEKLAGLGGKPVILALTCGTTMTGAHDDIGGAIEVLEDAGYGPDRRYVHVDGALNAMVVPFLPAAPVDIRPTFDHAIDSISTSGHKMIGTPMPCGVLVCRKSHSTRISRAVAYLRSNDTTLMGSRNGHAVLAIWARLLGHGYGRFAHDALRSTTRAKDLAGRLKAAGVDVLYNPWGMTVVFPEPDAATVKTYQLACNKGRAHAIVMPSVTDGLISRFEADYLRWAQA